MKRLMAFIGVILFLRSSAQVNFNYQISGSIVTFSITQAGQYYENIKWVFGDGSYASGAGLNTVAHTYTMNANYTVCVIGYPMPIAPIDTACKTIILTTVGIIENNFNDLPIRIYPNPLKDKLKIEFEQNEFERISISNCLGQIVYILNDPLPRQEIDLSSFSNGIYFLNIQSKVRQEVIKIIKE